MNISITEFSEKYFGFENNWHHRLMYEVLENKLHPVFGDDMLYVTEGKSIERRDERGKRIKKTGNPHDNRHVIILSPRNSAKSTAISFIYPLYLICQNPNIRILVVSANEEIATSFVRQVLYQLENNEKLLTDFGNLIPQKYTKWGERAFIVKRDSIEKDPTMSSAGLMGKIVSKRADVVILDDIIDMESSRTNAQRKKILEWYDNVLYPILEPKTGRVRIVGTAWHKGDFYDTMIQERDFDVKIKLKSIITYNKNHGLDVVLKPRFDPKEEPMGLDVGKLLSRKLFRKYYMLGLKHSIEDGSLWTSRWPFDLLIKQKEKMGDQAFCRQYLNEPVSGIDTFFSKSSVDQAYRFGATMICPKSYPETQVVSTVPQDMIVAMGVDLALSTAKTADYSAISVWGLSPDKRRYLLYLEKMKAGIEEVKQKIIDVYYLYHPMKVIVESNIFQDIIRANLAEEIDVEGIKTTAVSKFDEVRGLGHVQTLFDQGKIIIPNRHRPKHIVEFYNDLLSVRLDERTHTPDTVMASWFALQFLKNYDELITKTSGFFSTEGLAFQSKKLVAKNQVFVTKDGKVLNSVNSIFHTFVDRTQILNRSYFIFATYAKNRPCLFFFDAQTGEIIAKIDGTVSPRFVAEWMKDRAKLFNNSPIGVYKDYEGVSLLYELQNLNYPDLYVSYPREDGVPMTTVGVPPIPYLISSAFEFVKYKAQTEKTLAIRDKQTLMEMSRIISVSSREIMSSNQDDIPQRAITFSLGYYLLSLYNKKEKKEMQMGKTQTTQRDMIFKRPHYTIFNY